MSSKWSVARVMVTLALATQFGFFGYGMTMMVGVDKLLHALTHGGEEMVAVVFMAAFGGLLLPVARMRTWALIANLPVQAVTVLFLLPPVLFWFPRPHGFLDWSTFTLSVAAAFVGLGFGIVALGEARGKRAGASFRLEQGYSRQGLVAGLVCSLIAGMVSLGGAVAAAPGADASAVFAEAPEQLLRVNLGEMRFAEAPEQLLRVNLGEMRFEPNVLEVESGKATAIFVTNVTKLPHDFVVDQLGIKLVVEAGKTAVTIVKIDQPGTYTVYCSLDGHREAGMTAQLLVK